MCLLNYFVSLDLWVPSHIISTDMLYLKMAQRADTGGNKSSLLKLLCFCVKPIWRQLILLFMFSVLSCQNHIQWTELPSTAWASLHFPCAVAAANVAVITQLKWNIIAAAVWVIEQTGETVGTCSSVPALHPFWTSLCLPLLVAGKEKKKICPQKNMNYQVSVGWVGQQWSA